MALRSSALFGFLIAWGVLFTASTHLNTESQCDSYAVR